LNVKFEGFLQRDAISGRQFAFRRFSDWWTASANEQPSRLSAGSNFREIEALTIQSNPTIRLVQRNTKPLLFIFVIPANHNKSDFAGTRDVKS
jgi:hypothetical protein